MGYEGHFIDVEKAKTWSKDRIKAEIDDLRDEIQTQREEMSRYEKLSEEISSNDHNDPRIEKYDRFALSSEKLIDIFKADIRFLMSLL